MYCIGIVLYRPNTFENCIVYCIVNENAKSPGLAHETNKKQMNIGFTWTPPPSSSSPQPHPHRQVLLAIGGWNHGAKPFTDLVASGVAMQRFAQETTSFLRRFGFDGLDIDWEYPGGRKLYSQNPNGRKTTVEIQVGVKLQLKSMWA